MTRLHPRQIQTAGAVDGDALVYDETTDTYGPAAVTGDGGGSTTPGPWTTIVFAAGYESNEGVFGLRPQYRVNGDVVEFRGVLKRTTGADLPTALTTIFTMPAGARPGLPVGVTLVSDNIYLMGKSAASTHVRYQVSGSTGVCQIQAHGSTAWAALDGISYSITP